MEDEGKCIPFLDFAILKNGDVVYFEVGTNFVRYVTFTETLSSELSERFAGWCCRVKGP